MARGLSHALKRNLTNPSEHGHESARGRRVSLPRLCEPLCSARRG